MTWHATCRADDDRRKKNDLRCLSNIDQFPLRIKRNCTKTPWTQKMTRKLMEWEKSKPFGVDAGAFRHQCLVITIMYGRVAIANVRCKGLDVSQIFYLSAFLWNVSFKARLLKPRHCKCYLVKHSIVCLLCGKLIESHFYKSNKGYLSIIIK